MNTEMIVKREFKEMMINRQKYIGQYKTEDLFMFELPKVHLNQGLAKGIEEPFYKELNGTTFDIVYKQKVYKPQYLSDGSVRTDSEGKVVYDHIPVPRECVLIRSKKNIRLRLETEDGKPYQEVEEFQYIYYTKKKENNKTVKYYFYIIPRMYVYKLNLNALVFSRTKKRSYYSSTRVALQDGTYAFLSVVPVTGNMSNSTVLCVYPSLDFSSIIGEIVSRWYSCGMIFDMSLGYVNEGEENLCYMTLEPTLHSDEYNQLDGLIAQYSEEEDF